MPQAAPGAVPEGQFFGAVRRSRRFPPILCSESTYRPGMEVPRHVHGESLLVLVLQGSFEERSSRRTAQCEAGSLLYHPHGEGHGHAFSEARTRLLNILLPREWVERATEVAGRAPRAPSIMRQTRANWLAAQVHEEMSLGDSASSLAVEGLTLAILAELTRALPRGERQRNAPWVHRVREIVEARYLDHLSLGELAREVGVHPVHLSRTFRERFECTLTDYVRRLRLAHAARALLGSDTPIARIALDCGFADQGHFTRQFRAETGVTPARYRALRGVPARGTEGA